MIDLVSDHAPATHSPKRKFSFLFPHLGSGGGGDKSSSIAGGASGSSALTPTHGNASPFSKKKNFTEELQSIPDIQVRSRNEKYVYILYECSRRARDLYVSLVTLLTGGVNF